MTPSAAALTSVKEAIEVAKALGYGTQLATEVNDRGYVKKYGAEIVNPWTQEVVEVWVSVSTGNTAKMNAVVAALHPVETPANLTEITEDTDIDSLLAAHTKPVEPVKEIDLFALFTNV